MKQDQSNWIADFVCGIADICIRQIPERFAIFRHACNLLNFMCSANGDNVDQREKMSDTAPEQSAPKQMEKTDDSPPLQRQPQTQSPPPVRKISLDELPVEHRCWTGNDANRRSYHGKIPAGENPVYLELHWRKDKNASKKLVGGFILDVAALKKEGYLVQDPRGGIRVKFFHESDGGIYVGCGIDKKIPIGEVSA